MNIDILSLIMTSIGQLATTNVEKIDPGSFKYWTSHLSWNDAVGLVGLLLTLIGFWYTIAQVQDAKKQIIVMRQELDRSESIRNLSYVMSQLEDLVELASSSHWEKYKDKSSSISIKLAAFNAHPLMINYVGDIGAMVIKLQRIEKRVRVAVTKGVAVGKPQEIVAIAIESRDKISTILASVSHEVGRQ